MKKKKKKNYIGIKISGTRSVPIGIVTKTGTKKNKKPVRRESGTSVLTGPM